MTSWKACTNQEYEGLRNSRPYLELYNMEIHQKKAGRDYRNGNYETNAVVKNQGTKQRGQKKKSRRLLTMES